MMRVQPLSRRLALASVAALFALAPLAAAAQDAQEKKMQPEVAEMSVQQVDEKTGKVIDGGAVRKEILLHIADAEKKLAALAEATPADKYAWRPADGVRSIGEVYLHVAVGNYFLSTFFGGKPPAGIDLRNLEKQGGDKAKTIETMKKSFEFVRAAINAVPEADFGKPVKLFDHEGTYREAFVIVAAHNHEHLGQSIAYARMNKITPPWSAAGQ